MARWDPDAPGRLRQAALELFDEQGYDATTVAAIAQRAGLTERTFFRHYADKREVLFAGGEQLVELMTGAIAAAPADAPPFDAVVGALEAADEFFSARGLSRGRQRIIDSHQELRERELSKLGALADALAAALERRGTPAPAARLAAESGVAVFKTAFGRWVEGDDARDFATTVRGVAAELRAAAAALSAR